MGFEQAHALASSVRLFRIRAETERKGTSSRPFGRQITSRMRSGVPAFGVGSVGRLTGLGWARTKERARRASATSESGSRSSSHGIVVASALR